MRLWRKRLTGARIVLRDGRLYTAPDVTEEEVRAFLASVGRHTEGS